MAYLILDGANAILDIEYTDNGNQFVEDSELNVIAAVTHDHTAFDYIGGVIVANTARLEASLLQDRKVAAVNQEVINETARQARTGAAAKINAIENAANDTALDVILGL